eukprot:CAMPEP_0181314022 /NCGR_PEP_ID=MMETSP1101-20121128/14580_1 /TAXON_ID=46948 /ORGANISM="Rhodomonas abbreviata, Strain Caron Lab Isolate" /LENGTH=97 /DNA_ID=CAMNT_0023421055 /DNA_START=254 /DNA_END=547 /DNA_ORIENTATION=+
MPASFAPPSARIRRMYVPWRSKRVPAARSRITSQPKYSVLAKNQGVVNVRGHENTGEVEGTSRRRDAVQGAQHFVNNAGLLVVSNRRSDEDLRYVLR